jgi:hypothetical protein
MKGVEASNPIIHPAFSIQHPAPSTQHPAPSTQHPAPSTQHPAPSWSYDPPGSRGVGLWGATERGEHRTRSVIPSHEFHAATPPVGATALQQLRSVKRSGAITARLIADG